MSDISGIERLRSISVDDDRIFPRIAVVMNSCFGKKYKGYQSGFIVLKDGSDHAIWFPRMAKWRDGEWCPQKKTGWLNIMSYDGTIIIEEHEEDLRASISDDIKLPRYVFGRFENGHGYDPALYKGAKGAYRFLGEFVIDLEHSGRDRRVYRRIGDHIDLRRYCGKIKIPMPDPRILLANEAEDDDIVRSLSHDGFPEQEGFEYAGKPKKVKGAVVKDGIRVFPRDRRTAVNALAHAHFTCEVDPAHPTFIRKRSDRAYTEPHHLIPLSFQDQFDHSLDVEENIVSLCSRCHDEIHYGRDADRLIRKLYDERKEILASAGITIALDDLLTMYGYDVTDIQIEGR